MPLPFSRGIFIYGEPISVSPGANGAEMEEARVKLEAALIELTSRSDAWPRAKTPLER